MEEVLKNAIELWGERAQLEMAQEEATELALAIRKFIRNPNDKRLEDLASEIADVEIMIAQIKLMQPEIIEKVGIQKSFKLNRLAERLDSHSFEGQF